MDMSNLSEGQFGGIEDQYSGQGGIQVPQFQTGGGGSWGPQRGNDSNDSNLLTKAGNANTMLNAGKRLMGSFGGGGEAAAGVASAGGEAALAGGAGAAAGGAAAAGGSSLLSEAAILAVL